MIKRVAIFVLLVLSFPLLMQAREVTLTWEANSEPDLSHYIVYWGTASRAYTVNSGNIGLVTEHKVHLPDDGKIYFFAVTAVDTAGLESDFSNEVNTGEVKPKILPPGKPVFKKKRL